MFVVAGAGVTAAACGPARRIAQPVGVEPDLRVGLLVGVPSVRITGRGSTAAIQGESAAFRLAAGQSVTLTPDGRALRVSEGPGAGRYDRLTFVALDAGRYVEVDGKPYRGVIEVLAGTGRLTVVNGVPLEAYVVGVVNAEMGRRTASEQAALEAQAIVARTYALRNRGKFAGDGFDVRASVADQAYGGVDAETREGWEATRSTVGQILTYDGEPVSVFYHSTCGGSTASPSEAFRSVAGAPYLRPVSDRHGSGYYCDMSPRFRWSVEWDATTLHRILRRTVPTTLGVDEAAIDDITGVRAHRTGPSDRVTEARIAVTGGEIPVYGPDLRAVLETPDGRVLGSTAVRLEVTVGGGRLERLRADGKGWGHGVGMCQWGAVGRARVGQDARTILMTYFPGVRVERWY
jgi:stage II sporulation protein D